MNLVEVRCESGGVATLMGQMRSWLDAHHTAPSLFRIDGHFFRLEFGAEDDAMAFAEAFGGHVIGLSELPAA
jgi:arginine/ornithine N-succinyltransferase beta subunit